MSRTGIIYDDRMIEHSCIWDPNYPECPERYKQSLKRCEDYGLIKRCVKLQSRKATEEEILSVHSKKIFDIVKGTKDESDVEKLEKLAENYDSVYFHPKTFDSAMLSAGCTIELVSAILENKIKNGMAIVRPPGHHAMYEEVCGFCFFNNVALAAQHALNKYHLKRILIIDWDVHHGQATQYQFYNDPRVIYFSIHIYEHGAYWPELRESNFDYIGEGRGKGFNINVPLNEKGVENGDYLAIFNNILLPIAYEYSPELIIVSSGYDAAIGCPEGRMEVTPAAYAHFIHLLKGLANGKLCVILEGGYCISSLAEGVALTLRSLLGDPCPIIGEVCQPKKSVVETICNVIAVQRPYWYCLRLQGKFRDDKIDEFSDRLRHYPKIEYRGPGKKPEKYDIKNFYYVHSPEKKAEFQQRIQKLILDTKLDLPARKTSLIYDEEMENHKNMFERHIEIPERTKLSYKKLKDSGLFNRCFILKSRYATEDELSLIHSENIIKKLKASDSMTPEELTELNKEFFSFSVYLCKDSYKSAKLAAGCLLETVDSVLSGQTSNGISVIRPPGHHADYSQPAGFCIFNNVAIAAKYAIVKHNLNRILIVDWDIHHGNGTQNLFYDDPRVLYISLHRHENGHFYPFQTNSSHLGTGINEGSGYNVNIPWNTDEENSGMRDDDYLAAFFHIIMPIAYEFNPELVLISAGFDAAEGDPIGYYDISPECYGHMVHLLKTLAGGKVIVALEGGYNVESVSEGIVHCTSALLGDSCSPLKLGLSPSPNAIKTIKNVVEAHKKYWTSLKFDVDLPEYKTQITPLHNGELKSEHLLDSKVRRKKIDRPCLLPNWCLHLQYFTPPENLEISLNQCCQKCEEENQTLLCLHCFKEYCGKNANNHILQHVRENKHYFCIENSESRIWCYGCSSYINNLITIDIQRLIHKKRYGTDLPYFSFV